MSDLPLSWNPPLPDEGGAGQAVTRTGAPRLEMIDVLRGLVIVLMILDHVREYFSADALRFEATDLSQTTVWLFIARWVTHLCAPTFVFLAGASAFLQVKSDKPKAEVSRFLLTRGLWLIFLEVTLITFAFNFGEPFLFLQVIFAIGVGMILLAGLIYLPWPAILALGVVIIGGHQLLAQAVPRDLGAFTPVWQLMFKLGPLSWAPGLIIYPVVPWFGIMCLGYGMAPLFALPDRLRRPAFLGVALVFLLAFAVLRTLNGFGDPNGWSHQKDWLTTAMSFMKVTKQAPSIDYVLVTLGVSLFLGLLLENGRGLWHNVMMAFGRTPFFTYILHIYLVHTLALVLGLTKGVPAGAFTHFLDLGTDRLLAAHWGYSLPMVIFWWLVVVAVLYPISRAYMRLKTEKRQPWMSYL